jgi:hypothetical protein
MYVKSRLQKPTWDAQLLAVAWVVFVFSVCLAIGHGEDAVDAGGADLDMMLGPCEELRPQQAGNGKWGYVRLADIGPTEEVAWHISPQFDEVRDFQEGAAAVMVADRWGFIDEEGQLFVAPRFRRVSQFIGGYAPVCDDKGWGYINRRGDVTIPFQYDDAGIFTEGVAPVSKDGKWGYIDTTGAVVIAMQFDDAEVFIEGVARVFYGSKVGFIRKDARPLTDMRFDCAEPFTGGRAVVCSGDRYGVLDSFGRLVVPLELEEILPEYSGGLVGAKRDGKWGFIDLNGLWVVKPSYDRVGAFHHGIAVAVLEKDVCILDPFGNIRQRFPGVAAKYTTTKRDNDKSPTNHTRPKAIFR